MDIEEAEAIAVKYEILPLIKIKFTEEEIEKITTALKGLKHKDESNEEKEEDWFEFYKARIPILKEFSVVISDMMEEVIISKEMNHEKVKNGVIGAFRLLQQETGFEKNFTGLKYDAITTLLLQEIMQFDLLV